MISAADLEVDLDEQLVPWATDTRVALADGALVGYAYTNHMPSEVREERCYINGIVDPAWRGRGVGTALAGWATQRGAEQLLSSGRDLPRYLRAGAYDYQTDARDLYLDLGMRPVRYHDELLRPLTPLPTIPLPTTDDRHDVHIVPWPDDRDDEIRTAKNNSFADHWGSTPTSPARWEQMTRGYGSRLDLSFIALDEEGAVVAHCLNKRFEADDELLGRSDAWIDNLGTLRAWRGRGIASALIARSLHAFAQAGCSHASIGVDSENPTGAARLYRALGFEPRQRMITYERVIA